MTCMASVLDVSADRIHLLKMWFELTAVWGGAKLADVLELVGIPKFSYSTQKGGKHVEFVSIDRCKVQRCPI